MHWIRVHLEKQNHYEIKTVCMIYTTCYDWPYTTEHKQFLQNTVFASNAGAEQAVGKGRWMQSGES